MIEVKGSDAYLNNNKLGIDEFLSELRSKNIGQLESITLKTKGLISVLYYQESGVKYGLPTWSNNYYKRTEIMEIANTTLAVSAHTLKKASWLIFICLNTSVDSHFVADSFFLI